MRYARARFLFRPDPTPSRPADLRRVPSVPYRGSQRGKPAPPNERTALATNKATAQGGAKRKVHTGEWRALVTHKEGAKTVTDEWGIRLPKGVKVSVGDVVVVSPSRSERVSFSVATIADATPVEGKGQTESVRYKNPETGDITTETEHYNAYKVVTYDDRREHGALLGQALTALYRS